MSRNGSGTFSVINTMVANTTITAAAHNENYSDIGDEITNSVAADGQTTMTGNLKHASGTVSLPAMTFGADTDTGFYRVGENLLGIAIGGAKTVEFGTATASFNCVIVANGLPFPSGTSMMFVQTAAPTGWTKSTTHNDKALRVVSGAASSGGFFAFSTVFGKTATDGTSITQANLPSYNLDLSSLGIAVTDTHTHLYNSVLVAGAGTLQTGGSSIGGVTSTSGTSGGSITAALSGTLNSGGSGSAHTHPMDIRVQYVDVIIATKD